MKRNKDKNRAKCFAERCSKELEVKLKKKKLFFKFPKGTLAPEIWKKILLLHLTLRKTVNCF